MKKPPRAAGYLAHLDPQPRPIGGTDVLCAHLTLTVSQAFSPESEEQKTPQLLPHTKCRSSSTTPHPDPRTDTAGQRRSGCA